MNDIEWGSLYDRYERLALRVAWQFLYSLDDVRDVVQEAAAVAWARREELGDDEAFRSLFVGAVVNQCRRRRREYTRSTANKYDSQELDILETPEDIALRTELRHKMVEALASIPQEQAEPVVLCLVEGLSYADAAGVMDVTVPALRNNIYRGRRALRKKLENFLG